MSLLLDRIADRAATPVEHVGAVLTAAKRQGLDFDTAWTFALRTIPRGGGPVERAYVQAWRRELVWARESFRGSYHADEPAGAPLAPAEALTATSAAPPAAAA